MTFLEHLQELKNRLLVVVVVWVLGSAAGYLIRDQIIRILLMSRAEPLYFTSPAGGLDFLIKICLIFGFVVTIPVLIYEIFKFLEPVLPRQKKISFLGVVIASSVLMFLGMAFAYWVSLPAALHFLSSFDSGQIQALISAQEYLSFVTVYLGGSALAFQLPLVLLTINRLFHPKIKKLFSAGRFVILFSFIFAAVITPTPDFVNQTIMALPLILLYYSTILFMYLSKVIGINKRHARHLDSRNQP